MEIITSLLGVLLILLTIITMFLPLVEIVTKAPQKRNFKLTYVFFITTIFSLVVFLVLINILM